MRSKQSKILKRVISGLVTVAGLLLSLAAYACLGWLILGIIILIGIGISAAGGGHHLSGNIGDSIEAVEGCVLVNGGNHDGDVHDSFDVGPCAKADLPALRTLVLPPVSLVDLDGDEVFDCAASSAGLDDIPTCDGLVDATNDLYAKLDEVVATSRAHRITSNSFKEAKAKGLTDCAAHRSSELAEIEDLENAASSALSAAIEVYVVELDAVDDSLLSRTISYEDAIRTRNDEGAGVFTLSLEAAFTAWQVTPEERAAVSSLVSGTEDAAIEEFITTMDKDGDGALPVRDMLYAMAKSLSGS